MTDGNFQPPGWYHGAGDPPGTQRYWDGEIWVGEPVAAPTPAPGPFGPGTPPAPTHYPEQSGAVGALVTGILGLICCQLASPFAWKLGSDEIKAIDAGRRPPKDRGLAMAGKILGIIGTLLMVLMLVAVLLVAVTGSAIEAGT